jgi:dUTP pyrophosphatase|tara:strand:- start:1710 stop:2183 length:474 start_codon:yes stop_codon:yes gene_type:complete
MDVNYSQLNKEGKEPFQANESDAGYDLFSTEYITIEPFQRRLVSTGISIEIPEGFYGRIAPRSGLACKKGIDVMAGVIDSGYRGEIKVLLINLNFEGYNLKPNAFEAMFGSANKIDIKPGDRIAQLIIEKCYKVDWKKMKTLENSERGQGGFGSSGE